MSDARPYADQYQAVAASGLGMLLPLPAGAKYPPPTGFTGDGAPDPTPDQRDAWAEHEGNVALRVSDVVIGIDVDAYGAKQGAATLASAESLLGALPATWAVGSRGAGVSGIRLYRVPEGTRLVGSLQQFGPDVEIVQRGHRYAVWVGSLHPEGRPYALHGPEGEHWALLVPNATDLPALPDAWLEALAHDGESVGEDIVQPPSEWPVPGAITAGYVTAMLDALSDDVMRGDHHAWAYTQSCRLAAALRLGQVSEADLARGRWIILMRLSEGGRSSDESRQTEAERCWSDAVDRTARMSEEQAWNSLGASAPSHDTTFAEAAADLRSRGTVAVGPTRVPPRAGAGGTDKEGLDLTNAAAALDDLKQRIGTGPTSGIFLRGGELVHTPRIGEDGYDAPMEGTRDDDGPAQVRPLSAGGLLARAQDVYDCHRVSKDGDRFKAIIPAIVGKILADAPDTMVRIRSLTSVTHTPMIRADGSILEAPGYDEATGVLHLPEKGLVVPAVPEHPSAADVTRARELIEFMLTDYAFVSDDDRVNYIGATLLTPLLRYVVPGPYKFVIHEARQPGSGKTYLARTGIVLHGGVFRAEIPREDVELSKTITTILDTTTGPVVLFDNLGTNVVRSPVLAGLFTSTRWEDRRLGSSTMVSATNDRLWTATANNVQIGGDLTRRALRVRIDPNVPDPHLRAAESFAIPNYEEWVREHRGDLLWALLVFVRAWVSAGKPLQPGASSDSYAGWVSTVGGILTAAGFEGTFDGEGTRPEQAVSDDSEWADFLLAAHAWQGSRKHWTVKDLLADVDIYSAEDSVLPMDALPEELASKRRDGQPATVLARRLGIWLQRREGRWAGRLTVRSQGMAGGNLRRWSIEAPN